MLVAYATDARLASSSTCNSPMELCVAGMWTMQRWLT